MNTATKPNHIGRKISRIRERKEMKQEALAKALGTDQKAISIIENSETIDEEKLKEVAKALGVSVEAVKNFTEENMISYFNNFYDNSSAVNSFIANPSHCTFNALDKIMEMADENRKLYERLIQSEKEKNEYLEKLLKGK